MSLDISTVFWVSKSLVESHCLEDVVKWKLHMKISAFELQRGKNKEKDKIQHL